MRHQSIHRSRGFNLIEAMVALVVISIGLLGIAKMQALAMSSTGTAKLRSLAALEAASLASAIRADRTYWSTIATSVTVTFQDGVVKTATDGTLLSTVDCTVVGACSSITDMTAYDLRTWDTTLATQMPNHLAVLTCTAPAPGVVTSPVTCVIQMSWGENRVAINAQSTNLPSTTQFTLYVEP
jgi:type IV pilus assembly protein PilV